MAPLSLVDRLRATRWRVVFLIWTSVGAIDSVRSCVFNLATHHPAWQWPWVLATLASVWDWTLFTPVLFWVVDRAPLDRGFRPRRAAVHLLAFLLTVAIDACVITLVLRLTGRARESVPLQSLAQLIVDLLSYAAVVALAQAERYRAQSAAEQARAATLETQLTHAQLDALHMQLRPHFLFNTLHSVAALVRTAQNDEAVEMIAGLGDLLREVLRSDKVHVVTLRQELAFIERYLRIESVRFREQLCVRLTVPPELLDARVPHLILQPLVENAVRHGIGSSDRPGSVEVEVMATGQQLSICVRNSGNGARHHGEGVGLGNTRARLAALYGGRQAFELVPAADGGAEARLAIPLERAS